MRYQARADEARTFLTRFLFLGVGTAVQESIFTILLQPRFRRNPNFGWSEVELKTK
jgi:hypothetical protein